MAWHITHKGCADSHRARRSCPLRPDSRAGASGRFAHALRGVVMVSLWLSLVRGFVAPGGINQSWKPSPENFPEPFPLYIGGGEFRALESPKRGKTVNFGESMQHSSKPYPPLIATQHATGNQPGNCLSGAFCLPVWCNCQAFGYAAQ